MFNFTPAEHRVGRGAVFGSTRGFGERGGGEEDEMGDAKVDRTGLPECPGSREGPADSRLRDGLSSPVRLSVW